MKTREKGHRLSLAANLHSLTCLGLAATSMKIRIHESKAKCFTILYTVCKEEVETTQNRLILPQCCLNCECEIRPEAKAALACLSHELPTT